jgi:hypothetical protein
MKPEIKMVLLMGVLIVGIGVGGFFTVRTIARASEQVDVGLMTLLPLVLNQTYPQNEPVGEVISFKPRWELGASTSDPTIGAGGVIHGWYTKTVFANATRVDVELYLHAKGGTPGIGSGGYEIYLPDNLEPDKDWYVGHANIWIAGGGISEFDGSVKWTMRNSTKGPKLIFTFDGREWSPTHPKSFADLKLRANIQFWLNSP